MKLSSFLSLGLASMVSVTMAAPQQPDLPYPLVPLEVIGTIEGQDFRLKGTYDVRSTRICL
jgi:hypothetical protein